MSDELSRDEKEWISRAIEKDLTRLQVKKKLSDSGYNWDKIDNMIDYFDSIKDNHEEIEREEQPIQTKEETEEFKNNIKTYFEGNKKDLSGKERRFIKKYMKSVNAYNETLKKASEKFRKELEAFEKEGWSFERMAKETEYLKREIIDRVMDLTELLEVDHPITGEEINKENLKSLNIKELINLIDEGNEVLDLMVNGKITE